MMPLSSFLYRLGWVIAILACLLVLEIAVKGKRATRPKSYSFLIAVALLGAGYGVIIGQCTSRISPHYFSLGKGISLDDPLALVSLGFQAGFSAALVVGGCLLVTNHLKASMPRVSHRFLFHQLFTLTGTSLAFGGVGAALSVAFGPLELLSDITHGLSTTETARFCMTWTIHLGLYLGALIGLVHGCIRVLCHRAVLHVTNS